MIKKIQAGLLLLCLALSAGVVMAQDPPPQPPPGGGGGQNGQATTFDDSYEPVENTYEGIGVVSMGVGELIDDFSLTPDGCTTGERYVAAETGMVIAEDGSEWIVPMEMSDGAGTVDIFNNCTSDGDNPDYLDELETVVIDEDGEVITAWIFGDNYFELYINGEYVGRDNIGFVPFNSTAVRFQVSYPYTISVRLADWETHFGIGMEYDSYNIGDAGFIALFSDGTMTNDDWRVQVGYIAPLDDPGCVVEDEFGNPDSSGCGDRAECATMNADVCRALHYELPEDWMSPDFDDSNWLNASLYEAEEVTNQRGYADYADLFGDAQFIWSANLDLDNYVVARYTVEAPE